MPVTLSGRSLAVVGWIDGFSCSSTSHIICKPGLQSRVSRHAHIYVCSRRDGRDFNLQDKKRRWTEESLVAVRKPQRGFSTRPLYGSFSPRPTSTAASGHHPSAKTTCRLVSWAVASRDKITAIARNDVSVQDDPHPDVLYKYTKNSNSLALLHACNFIRRSKTKQNTPP